MSNIDDFERLYNELEDLLRARYRLESTASAVYFYESRVGGPDAKNLRVLRELRNFLVHEKLPGVLDAVTVTDSALAFHRRMIDSLENPKTAFRVCIPRDRILCANLATPVLSLMRQMLDRNISHVPVMTPEGVVYGVFSGATMFAALTDAQKTGIGPETTLRAFEAWLPMHKHIGERYWFVSKNAEIDDLIGLFGETFKDGKKLKMLFVTENGKPQERLLGLITPWDILDDDVVPAR